MSLKLKNLIAVLACVPVLVIIIYGNAAIYSNQHGLNDKIINYDLGVLQNAADLGAHLGQMKRYEKNYMIFRDKAYFDNLKAQMGLMEEHLKNFSELAKVYPHVSPVKHLIDQALERYKEIIAKLPDMTTGQYKKANDELRDLTDGIFGQLEQIQTGVFLTIEGRLNNQQYNLKNLVVLISAGMIFFALICLAWTLLVWRSVILRITRLKLASQRLAKGGFRPMIEPGPIDEIGRLILDFNNMSQRIADREDKIENLNTELIKLTNQLKSSPSLPAKGGSASGG